MIANQARKIQRASGEVSNRPNAELIPKATSGYSRSPGSGCASGSNLREITRLAREAGNTDEQIKALLTPDGILKFLVGKFKTLGTGRIVVRHAPRPASRTERTTGGAA